MIIGYYLATHTEQGGTAGVSVDPTEWNSPRYSYTDGSFIGRQSSSRTVAALPLGNSSPRFATTKVTQRQCFFPCRYRSYLTCSFVGMRVSRATLFSSGPVYATTPLALDATKGSSNTCVSLTLRSGFGLIVVHQIRRDIRRRRRAARRECCQLYQAGQGHGTLVSGH